MKGHKIAEKYNPKEFGTGCVNVTPFGTNIIKHLKLKRFIEMVTYYINKDREVCVAC